MTNKQMMEKHWELHFYHKQNQNGCDSPWTDKSKVASSLLIISSLDLTLAWALALRKSDLPNLGLSPWKAPNSSGSSLWSPSRPTSAVAVGELDFSDTVLANSPKLSTALSPTWFLEPKLAKASNVGSVNEPSSAGNEVAPFATEPFVMFSVLPKVSSFLCAGAKVGKEASSKPCGFLTSPGRHSSLSDQS